MKRFLHNFKTISVCSLRFSIVPVLFLLFVNFASAQQTTVIPDSNFEQALIDLAIDSAPINGSVLTANIIGVTSLDVRGRNISDLTGIQDFASLQELYCSNNNLTSLDVRGLTLTKFECLTNNPLLTVILVDDVSYANLRGSLWMKEGTATYANSKCNVTNTWDGTSWSPSEPTDVECAAVIAGNYDRSGDIKAYTLTINNNASVTIPSGSNVTLSAALTVTSGSNFTLSNNANLIQTNRKSVNSGNVNVIRDSSPLFRLDYTMWSSPVTGTQTFGAFSSMTLSNRFYQYNSATDKYNSIASTGTFSPSKGYLIRMPDNWVDYVPLPGTPAIPLSWTGTFIGKPNNGDISFVSVSNGKYAAVGNPYPSTVNIDKFIDGNNGQINGTLWFWRKRNDASNLTSYSTCTKAGCTLNNSHSYLNDNFISVGQGFIVKATSSGQVKFTNSMRVENNENQFFKTKKIEKDRIWLNLSMGSTPVNQMLLAYMAGATQGIDQAIDGAYFNDSPTALNSLIDNEEYAIQGRGLPFDGTDVVPLAFKSTTTSDFTIAIDHAEGLFASGQDVYLLDSKTGIETNLKTSSYTFNAASGVDNVRFSLKYQKALKVDAPSFDDNNVTVYKNKGTLTVNSKAMPISNIKVFDILGRLIAEQKNVKANTITLPTLKATSQVLILKVTGEDSKVVSKKVVY